MNLCCIYAGGTGRVKSKVFEYHRIEEELPSSFKIAMDSNKKIKLEKLMSMASAKYQIYGQSIISSIKIITGGMIIHQLTKNKHSKLKNMANCNKLFLDYHQNLKISADKRTRLMNSKEVLRERIKNYFKKNHPEYVPEFWIQGSYK